MKGDFILVMVYPVCLRADEAGGMTPREADTGVFLLKV